MMPNTFYSTKYAPIEAICYHTSPSPVYTPSFFVRLHGKANTGSTGSRPSCPNNDKPAPVRCQFTYSRANSAHLVSQLYLSKSKDFVVPLKCGFSFVGISVVGTSDTAAAQNTDLWHNTVGWSRLRGTHTTYFLTREHIVKFPNISGIIGK